MITCRECLERMKPDDPRVRTGRYHHSTCDYFCNKPDYERSLPVEEPMQVTQPINITYQIDAKSTPAFKELEEEIRFLKGRMTKYFDKKGNKDVL